MISNRDIIIFGDDWGRYPSTIQHIGKVIAKQNRIIWVGSLGLRKPKLNMYDIRRVWEKAKGILRKSSVELNYQNNVYLVHPFVLPFHDNEWIYRLNMLMIRNAIQRKMRDLGFKNPILFSASPITEGVIGKLEETSSHYFCLDDFTLFDDAFDSLGRLEQKLVSKVNSCFSISETLLETRKAHSNNNYFLPQGVNINHFIQSKNNISPAVANLKHPIIGFFGILTTWVDIELILSSAMRYRNYTFLILGKTTIDISLFSKATNIIYMGEIPFAELPKYASAFDVGIIPFLVNDLTIACNPLKLLEYLALGIPVVSTNMPEVKKMEPHVIVADTSEEFISGIEKAVSQISPENNMLRRKYAEKYSWESIVEDISNKIIDIEQR
jgi:glycosyltransferase involved in cell wall biosynthesis